MTLSTDFILILFAILLTCIGVLLVMLFFAGKRNQKFNHQHIDSEIRIKLLEQEKIMSHKKAVAKERARISKELHDDIGSSISSLKIYQNLALKEFDSNPQKAIQYLNKSMYEISIIEESLSDLIWAIYSKNKTSEDLLLRMKQYAFDTLSAKEIESSFSYPDFIKEIQLPIEYRKNLLLLFKEFVNNTAKYSEASTFSFQVNADQNQVTVHFMDNGKGFNIDEVRRGKGLTNMKIRADDMHAAYFYHTKPGEGVRLTLIIPILKTD